MDPQKMELYYEELRRMKELKKKDYKNIFRNDIKDNVIEKVPNRHQIRKELKNPNQNKDFKEYHTYIKRERNEKEDIDICILGGGPTGTYLARRLAFENPSKRILLIEKTNSLSEDIDSSSFSPLKTFYTEYFLEFGNQRTFEKDLKMKHVCEILGIEKEKERNRRPYSYYLRSKLNESLRFNLDEDDLSFDIKNEVKEYLKKNHNIYSFFEESTRFTFELEKELNKVSFNDDILSLLSDEGKCFHLGKNGLDRIENESLYSILYTILERDEKRVEWKKNGEEICQKLMEKYHQISFEQMKNSRFQFSLYSNRNHFYLLQTRCESFEVYDKDDIEVSLLYQDGTITNRKKVQTKELYITYDLDDLMSIYKWDLYYQRMIREKIETRPYFEFYVYFEDDSKIPQYNLITDGKINVFEHYEGKVYYGRSYRDIWYDKININIQKEMIYEEKIIEIIWEEMKKYYERGDIPKGSKISWKYEREGMKRWNRLKNESLGEIKNCIRYPFTDKVNVYYLHQNISLLPHHWEGAIEEVESLFEESSILDMSLL